MKNLTLMYAVCAAVLGHGWAQTDSPNLPPGEPDRPERGARPEHGPRPPMATLERLEKRTFLGVATGGVEPALRAQLGLAKGTGLIVGHVDPESPAASILQQHDVLTRFDDQILVNPDQLAVLVENRKPGDTVALIVLRGGKEQAVTATLGEREAPVHGEGGPRFGFQPWMGMGSGQGMEEARRMGRETQERIQEELRRQREQMEEQVRDLRRNLDDHHRRQGERPPGRPEEGRGPASPEPRRTGPARNSTWVQDQVIINLVENAEGRHLTINDGGKEVFSGPINTEAERAGVPEEYREAVERLEQQVNRGKEAPREPAGEVL